MHVTDRLMMASARVTPGDSPTVGPLLARMTAADADRFVAAVRFHRVVPQVCKNLSELSFDDPRARDNAALVLSAFTRERPEITERIRTHLDATRDLARAIETPLVGLKGVCFTRFYAMASHEREMGDVDVYVPSVDELWRLLAELVDRKFSIEKIRFGRYSLYRETSLRDMVHGICPTTAEESDGRIALDVHFGWFPACGEGAVQLGPSDTVRSGDLWEPTPEKTIAIAMAHIVRQGFVRFRDVNDLYLLFRYGRVDRDRLETEITRTDLLPVYRSVWRMLHTSYPELRTSERRMTVLDRQLLFERRSTDVSFHDGVKSTVSRLLQIRYLTSLYTRYLGRVRGTARALRNSVHLFESGRPYRVWTTRRTGEIGAADRFVLVPLHGFDASVDLRHRRLPPELPATYFPEFGFLVIKAGAEDELVVSPGLICAQAPYVGGRAQVPDSAATVEAVARALQIPALKALR